MQHQVRPTLQHLPLHVLRGVLSPALPREPIFTAALLHKISLIQYYRATMLRQVMVPSMERACKRRMLQKLTKR